jgi:5'-methylthioadenosine phosphorylase
MREIPRVEVAVIGGSSSMDTGFPESFDGVEVLSGDVVYDTPFGPTAPFTHASVEGKQFLTVPFHGITRGIRNTEPDSAGERVFYVLWRASVRKIIGTALCGSSNRLLDPADVVIPDGFVDYTSKRAQSLFRSLEAKGVDAGRTMYRLHQSFCPTLSASLCENAKRQGFPRVFGRGVVGVSEGPRLESPDEVRIRYTNAGIDVITMNLVPEVYFAREIGACYAALELVSNYGEGLVSTGWEGREAFGDFMKRWNRSATQAILDTVKLIDPGDDGCGCLRHRWGSVVG